MRRPPAVALAAMTLAGVVLAGCTGGETAIMRGDRLWADSQFTEALAEYRLALSQSGGSDEALLRAAHAFAVTGEFDGAKAAWDELLERAPGYTDQAVYDYLLLARRERAESNLYGMARAVEAAVELRPELPLDDLNLPLADYYIGTGNDMRALAFYERALAHAPADSAAELLYTLGELHEQAGECRKALDYFRAYRHRVRRGPRASEAAWHLGNCAYRLARAEDQAGDLNGAMAFLETVVDLGVPENVQEDAWFQRGEILYTLGRFDEALAAYRQVLRLNRQRTGRLDERAQSRIDEIRFGRVPDDPVDRAAPFELPPLDPGELPPVQVDTPPAPPPDASVRADTLRSGRG